MVTLAGQTPECIPPFSCHSVVKILFTESQGYRERSDETSTNKCGVWCVCD